MPSATLKSGALHYIGAALVATVTVFGISLFNISSIKEGIIWGIVSWATFIATSHFSGVIWAKNLYKYILLISLSYQLLIILFNMALLLLWK